MDRRLFVPLHSAWPAARRSTLLTSPSQAMPFVDPLAPLEEDRAGRRRAAITTPEEGDQAEVEDARWVIVRRRYFYRRRRFYFRRRFYRRHFYYRRRRFFFRRRFF